MRPHVQHTGSHDDFHVSDFNFRIFNFGASVAKYYLLTPRYDFSGLCGQRKDSLACRQYLMLIHMDLDFPIDEIHTRGLFFVPKNYRPRPNRICNYNLKGKHATWLRHEGQRKYSRYLQYEPSLLRIGPEKYKL